MQQISLERMFGGTLWGGFQTAHSPWLVSTFETRGQAEIELSGSKILNLAQTLPFRSTLRLLLPKAPVSLGNFLLNFAKGASGFDSTLSCVKDRLAGQI